MSQQTFAAFMVEDQGVNGPVLIVRNGVLWATLIEGLDDLLSTASPPDMATPPEPLEAPQPPVTSHD